jgi:hypothetical protein
MRPFPPVEMFGVTAPDFIPAHEIGEWAINTFLDEESPLFNADHQHLLSATIGWLWTSVPNNRHMMAVAGQAEIPRPQGGKWQKRRGEQLLRTWFPDDLDFLITLDANYAAACGDASFCALVEHEMYHCGQALDDFGAPKFNKTKGKPAFALRGHDVEEFVGIIRRYGVGAGAGRTLELVEAAQRGPQLDAAEVKAACGSCRSLIGA